MSTPALNPLVEKIRGKYPGAYDDMDDAALTKAILAKYPQYSDLAAPPMAKPSVKMDTGEGPIAAGLTSFETQLSNVPAATGQFLKSAAQGFPEATAEHARVLAGQEDPLDEAKHALQKVNPVVTNSEGVDYGATAANVLPLLLSAKGKLPEEVSPTARAVVSAAPDAVAAAVKKLPSSVIRNIPWIGDVLHDMYTAGADAYRKAQPALDKGAPLPETPTQEVLQANSLARGPQPVVDPAAGLGQIPARYTPPSMAEAKPVEPAAPTVAKRAPRGAAAGAQNFKAIQQAQALREQTPNIVDQAIPPEVSKGENAAAKIQVDEALKKGDVAAAEEVLSRRAKNAGLQWPPDAPVSRGSTNDIRANLPGNRSAVRADQLDTHGIQQEMAQDLERHGQMAESDARKEFIARNSFDTTKGQLIKDSKIAQPDEDLTDVLPKSIEEANRKRAAQLNAKP